MAGGNNYAIGSGHLLVFRDGIERGGAVVHRRHERIGLEAQKQFAHLRIGLGTDVSGLRFKSLGRPWQQSPVLVIYEDAPVFHGRAGMDTVLDLHADFTVMLRRHVRPPVPGGHAYL